MVSMLTDAGYAVHYRILNCRPLVPQRRQRLYFVGFLSKGEEHCVVEPVSGRIYPAWLEGDFSGNTRVGGHSNNLAASRPANAFEWPFWARW